MKNIFNLMKETPEERDKRQAETKPVAQNKANALINQSIKEANANDASNAGKGTDKAPVSK
jgi:hypothetical protein